MFSMCLFCYIGMRYSGHLPSVDDASVVGDAFVYDTSVDNASVMMNTTLTCHLRNT